MRKVFLPLFLVSVIWGLLNLFSTGMAAAMEKENKPKNAILLVAFGTSVSEAAKALEEIENRVRKAHGDYEIRWAYTSKTIRSRFAARGKIMDSPETALSRLMDEGFTRVALLSLHVVPGREFHDLQQNVSLFARMSGGFGKIMLGRPLLGDHSDMTRAAEVLSRKFPVPAGEGVVFIGHGNAKHPSDAIYLAMDSLLKEHAPNLFVGTVQGNTGPEKVAPRLVSAKIRKVRLVPLMTLAGEHARTDMAGDGEESWKSVLAKNGIQTESVFSGLAEYPEIVAIWMDHLDEILARMSDN
jgi:sirohydrochlorin cobaltochelatase